MNIKKDIAHNREGGNAVTLTLLGLAVAILAGVVMLYYVGKSTPKPTYIPDPVDEEVFEPEATTDPREGWREYTNDTYDFSLEFPQGWAVATGTLETGDPVITVYPAIDASTTPTYSHQDIADHVSIYPDGIAAEGIVGKLDSSKVAITIPQATAKDYVLISGKAWATKATFDTYPASWGEAGFAFARMVVEEEELVYMRGDTQIEQYEFDPLSGDHIERSGFVDSNMRDIQKEILQSLMFTQEEGNGEAQVNAVEHLITVESPHDGEMVTSPLLVQGEARGEWYFEGSFPVRLETEDGSVVTEAYATALGEWMSDEYVPFEVSLAFEAPTATSGRLVLMNSNPSGLIENAKEIAISILFTTTQ